MSRFVLDCAVSRPVGDLERQWWAAATQRGWAASTAGYHEGKTASALLHESCSTLAALVGARSAWFAPDHLSALTGAVAEVTAGMACVATSAADSMTLREATVRAAALAGLPHTILDVDPHGRLTGQALAALAAPAVLATAVGNQEIGTLQTDLATWSAATGSAVVLDASTAFGWIDLPVGWQRLVLDARAWGGVPGAVGVCATGAGSPRPFDNVPAAVVAGLSAQRWNAVAGDLRGPVRARLGRLAERVRHEISGVEVRGAGPRDLPHILSISVLYVDAEALQTRLDALGYAVGSGSACASRTGEPSHVLAAVGGLTGGNLRIGLPPQADDAVTEGFADALVALVAEQRAQMGTDRL